MRPKKRLYLGSLLSAVALFFAPFSGAQQKTTTVSQTSTKYDATRESLVQGTVVSYTAASTTPPIGPHVKIQTSSAVLDVHLGNASLIKQNDMILAPGDSLSIVGENVSFGSGSVFMARVLKKGSQTVTLRNLNGIPIAAKPPANAKARSILGGAR
jgi:hypothetical protein